MTPTVSVAMTTFNGATYLGEQLESLLNQTVLPAEIVVCDDCSEDDTASIIGSYALRYSRIRFFSGAQNLGFVGNFGKCISLCRGEYIALCDQDDIWEPNKIETLTSAIGDKTLIHSDARVIDEAGTVIGESWSRHYGKDLEQPFTDSLAGINIVTGCTALFRAELRDLALPFPQEVPSHDSWLALVAYRNGGVAYCPERLMRYRLHHGNAIGNLKGLRKSKAPDPADYLSRVIQDQEKLRLTEGEIHVLMGLRDFYLYRRHHWICWPNLFRGMRYGKHIFGRNAGLLYRVLASVKGNW